MALEHNPLPHAETVHTRDGLREAAGVRETGHARGPSSRRMAWVLEGLAYTVVQGRALTAVV